MPYIYDNLYVDKKVYFAGPEVYFPWGDRVAAAQKAAAAAWGIATSQPENRYAPDANANADAVFADIVAKMKASDYVIANVDPFRGNQPDSGTAFDLGMAYALGLKSYVVTRDKRKILQKSPFARLNPEDEKPYDADGRPLPEAENPVNLMISGSSKVIEGTSFEVGLSQLFLDLEMDAKAAGAEGYVPPKVSPVVIPQGPPWKVYAAGAWVFEPNRLEIAAKIRALCAKYNLECVFPVEEEAPRPVFANPWSYQRYVFDLHINKVKESNVLIACLDPFQGYEPDCGTAFECGAAYLYGHKMYGYMENLAPMIHKVPNAVKADGRHYDVYGAVVEDYGYPANLRFGSAMQLFEGTFETVIRQVAVDLGTVG